MGDIGLDGPCFVDRQGRRIDFMFKLYPWEWMFADEFGRAPALLRTRFVEPPWKMILSGKGMLALLWDMAPGHPNLLPCYFEDDPRAASLGDRYARKPLYSREGADIELIDGASIVRGSTDGYGAEGYVRQALCPLPDFDGRPPRDRRLAGGRRAGGHGNPRGHLAYHVKPLAFRAACDFGVKRTGALTPPAAPSPPHARAGRRPR